jgi:osmotically-inducible protein OsmY
MDVTDDELRACLQTFVDNAITPSAGAVSVAVDRGVVTLTGRVASATQRHAIRDLVAATTDVRHVVYAIEVGSPKGTPARA